MIPCNSKEICFKMTDFMKGITFLPHLHKYILYNILCLSGLTQQAECYAVYTMAVMVEEVSEYVVIAFGEAQ